MVVFHEEYRQTAKILQVKKKTEKKWSRNKTINWIKKESTTLKRWTKTKKNKTTTTKLVQQTTLLKINSKRFAKRIYFYSFFCLFCKWCLVVFERTRDRTGIWILKTLHNTQNQFRFCECVSFDFYSGCTRCAHFRVLFYDFFVYFLCCLFLSFLVLVKLPFYRIFSSHRSKSYYFFLLILSIFLYFHVHLLYLIRFFLSVLHAIGSVVCIIVKIYTIRCVWDLPLI